MDNRELMVTIRCLAYNHESYIRQCLEGFVMQKTNFRFEAIVHDDASTDGTAAIIREYAEKYPDIIKPIFETENQYSKRDGSIRRIMDEHTYGKYIAMCEGDDYWTDPLKLQKQVDFMEQNEEYSMCFHNAVKFYEDMRRVSEIFCKITESREVSIEEITESWIIPTASMLYRRSVIDDYPEWASRIYSGDLTLQLIAYNKGKLYYINQIMSFYRLAYYGASSSSQMLEKLDFVYAQHALLYELYNKYTNYKYQDILSKRILYNRKHSKFIKYRKKNLLYAFMRMPVFFVAKLCKRLF